MTSKKPEPLTSVLRNGGFSSSYDSLVQGSSTVLRLNFCAINPPLRKAGNRCTPLKKQFHVTNHTSKTKKYILIISYLNVYMK